MSITKPIQKKAPKLGFLHHIKLVPLFVMILSGILLLFILCVGLVSYFLIQSERTWNNVTEENHLCMSLANTANFLRNARINMDPCGSGQ